MLIIVPTSLNSNGFCIKHIVNVVLLLLVVAVVVIVVVVVMVVDSDSFLLQEGFVLITRLLLKDYYGMLGHTQKGQWKGRREKGMVERSMQPCSLAQETEFSDSQKNALCCTFLAELILLWREKSIPAIPTQALCILQTWGLCRAVTISDT